MQLDRGGIVQALAARKVAGRSVARPACGVPLQPQILRVDWSASSSSSCSFSSARPPFRPSPRSLHFLLHQPVDTRRLDLSLLIPLTPLIFRPVLRTVASSSVSSHQPRRFSFRFPSKWASPFASESARSSHGSVSHHTDIHHKSPLPAQQSETVAFNPTADVKFPPSSRQVPT